jgi:hypothetical protein
VALFPNTHPINTLTEKAEFRAFAGPPLMPFWKITDLVMYHVPHWGQPSVSGYTMVNNPFQPPLQAPERTISIERTLTYLCYSGTVAERYLPPLSPPSPAFFSVTVVGPDGRDPREAFPPR